MVERRTSEDSSFMADGLAGNAPPETFPTGRLCAHTDCGVKLSRYNSTEWCALHESPASTGRPFDTSTRQRGRRRNSSASRRELERVLANNVPRAPYPLGDRRNHPAYGAMVEAERKGAGATKKDAAPGASPRPARKSTAA